MLLPSGVGSIIFASSVTSRSDRKVDGAILEHCAVVSEIMLTISSCFLPIKAKGRRRNAVIRGKFLRKSFINERRQRVGDDHHNSAGRLLSDACAGGVNARNCVKSAVPPVQKPVGMFRAADTSRFCCQARGSVFAENVWDSRATGETHSGEGAECRLELH